MGMFNPYLYLQFWAAKNNLPCFCSKYKTYSIFKTQEDYKAFENYRKISNKRNKHSISLPAVATLEFCKPCESNVRINVGIKTPNDEIDYELQQGHDYEYPENEYEEWDPSECIETRWKTTKVQDDGTIVWHKTQHVISFEEFYVKFMNLLEKFVNM